MIADKLLVVLFPLLVSAGAYLPSPTAGLRRDHRRHHLLLARQKAATPHRRDGHCDPERDFHSEQRRNIVTGAVVASAFLSNANVAQAASPLFARLLDGKSSSSLYVVSPVQNKTVTPQREPIFSEPTSLSSEICLLKLLPVKSPLIRSLEANLVDLSTLAAIPTMTDTWRKASKTMEAAVQELDNKRSQLVPVFNPEDSTLLAISKGERGEQLIESLRGKLVELVGATKAASLPQTLVLQKEALLSLSEVGELLVSAFPYKIPTEGKYSYLPRLLGRARVTFTFRRKNEILGNMTIVADGFTAPISAGNFVDLCVRNFYTGLPVKYTKKRVGSGSDFDVASVPILGSYQEGFYDPLTAKPRRIPLEIIRVEKSNGSPNLSYSQGLTGLPANRAVLESPSNSQPLLSFVSPRQTAPSSRPRSYLAHRCCFLNLARRTFLVSLP
jgi:hypothetical protein